MDIVVVTNIGRETCDRQTLVTIDLLVEKCQGEHSQYCHNIFFHGDSGGGTGVIGGGSITPSMSPSLSNAPTDVASETPTSGKGGVTGKGSRRKKNLRRNRRAKKRRTM